MQKEKLIVRYAEHNDFKKLTQFRIEQFLSAKEFTVKTPEKLANVGGDVFIVESNNKIISTVQVEKMPSKDFFKQYSNATFLAEPTVDIFPSLYTSKAGTDKSYRNTGIYGYLRMLLLKQAINNNLVMALNNCAYENAPRLNLLRKLGYEFTEVKLSETAYTVPNGKFFFVYLERNKFDNALQILEKESADLLSNFDIELQF